MVFSRVLFVASIITSIITIYGIYGDPLAGYIVAAIFATGGAVCATLERSVR